MTKKVFSVAVAALALVFLSMPAHAITASAAPADHVVLGNYDIGNPIKGDLERTTNFDVIPGQEFTFDMNLRNTENIENTANVVLRLIMPNSGEWVMFNEDITLEGLETFLYQYAENIPGNLTLYGRYTLHLLIDNRVADLIQFDLNSRTEIVVQWDDGVMTNAYCWYSGGNKWAIRGCMPPGAVIDEITAWLLSENDPYWPWPDAVHQAIELQIWDEAGGLPGSMTYSSGDVYVDPATSECTAYPGVSAPQPAFFVANNQLTDYPACEGQNVDGGVNHPDQMFAEIDGVWQQYSSISGDLMMRAIGHVGAQVITIGNAE
jgi:hypothetical protein